jgi:hypothetical protein
MNNEKKPSDFDLVLTRVIDVPPHLVWKAWTVPRHLEQGSALVHIRRSFSKWMFSQAVHFVP